MSVPREIQQMLVDMGDKSKSFVGSREWIGAIELSYILDNHMGVSAWLTPLPGWYGRGDC